MTNFISFPDWCPDTIIKNEEVFDKFDKKVGKVIEVRRYTNPKDSPIIRFGIFIEIVGLNYFAENKNSNILDQSRSIEI